MYENEISAEVRENWNVLMKDGLVDIELGRVTLHLPQKYIAKLKENIKSMDDDYRNAMRRDLGKDVDEFRKGIIGASSQEVAENIAQDNHFAFELDEAFNQIVNESLGSKPEIRKMSLDEMFKNPLSTLCSH